MCFWISNMVSNVTMNIDYKVGTYCIKSSCNWMWFEMLFRWTPLVCLGEKKLRVSPRTRYVIIVIEHGPWMGGIRAMHSWYKDLSSILC